MNSDTTVASPGDLTEEPAAPACVMSFNFSDPTGATGLPGDQATIAAMGAHALPIVTSLLMRDTAEIVEVHPLDTDLVAEQARIVLEDISVAGFKVGFLGSPETVSAVAEILSDYPDLPTVTYLAPQNHFEEDDLAAYHDALRELILPQTEVLVGNQQALAQFLLPEWAQDRAPTPRELALQAAEHGTRHVLVTGIPVRDQHIDNVLASSQGPITGEKFERFDMAVLGAGETLSAALAALLACAAELPTAVAEALSYLDQALDAGFRPGMGMVMPDRFFWALPPGEDFESSDDDTSGFESDEPAPPPNKNQMH